MLTHYNLLHNTFYQQHNNKKNFLQKLRISVFYFNHYSTIYYPAFYRKKKLYNSHTYLKTADQWLLYDFKFKLNHVLTFINKNKYCWVKSGYPYPLTIKTILLTRRHYRWLWRRGKIKNKWPRSQIKVYKLKCFKFKLIYFKKINIKIKKRLSFFIKNLFFNLLSLTHVLNIKKKYYNQLTLNTTYYLKNKTNMILYYNTELNFIFQQDFKNQLFFKTINILARILASTNILTKTIAAQSIKNSFIWKQEITNDIFYRREFAAIFGVLPIKVKPMRIKKIQFKPGYLRFFRRIRIDYKKTNNLYFVYQWRLTTYLKRFKSLNNAILLRSTVFSFRFLLVSLHFFSTLKLAEKAISSGFFFINGWLCLIPSFQVQTNDYIQVRLNYYFYNYILNQLYERKHLLKYGFSLLNQYSKIKKLWKQNLYPRQWYVAHKLFKKTHLSRLTRYYYILYDIPRYVELDFFTLSFIIITTPNNIQDFDYITMRRAAITYIKMLNWKYIN